MFYFFMSCFHTLKRQAGQTIYAHNLLQKGSFMGTLVRENAYKGSLSRSYKSAKEQLNSEMS